MIRTLRLAVVVASAMALAVACGKSSPTPSSPSAVTSGTADAAADGSTLKVTAPTPVSPINDAQPPSAEFNLVVTNATTRFANPVPLLYRFEIFNAGGARVYQSALVTAGASGTTSFLAPIENLEGEQRYSWRARAEYEGEIGPWSGRPGFIAPQTGGYIRGNELYDPLVNGRTVGIIHGPVTFIPGVGVKLESQLSYISYELPETLTEGEFSILVTGMPANTEGNKTKLFAMAQGYSDIVTNDRRMTVEKRGDPPGIIAWRFLTHGDQVDTEGPERRYYNFQEHLHYFWEATWRNNFFNVLVKENGVDGHVIYNMGKPFRGRAYDPKPHVIYLGAPVGRSGEAGASVDRAIIRQVWVSPRPRPQYANK